MALWKDGISSKEVEHEVLFPTKNGAGLPVVPMSAEQKDEFDLNGFIVLPSLLSEAEVVACRDHQLALKFDPESLSETERDYHGGPSVVLLDHPVVVGVLNEVLSYQNLASEDCYGFRFDHTGLKYRVAAEEQPDASWAPHGGGGLFVRLQPCEMCR